MRLRLSVYPDCFLELYKASQGGDVGLSFADFGESLLDLARNEFGPGVSNSQILDFCKKLHIRDLALAQACSRGSVIAWERFLHRYREKLYAAALMLARDESVARELTDSISGDLFGLATAGTEVRGSKLASYTGRGSLDSWLKAVLTHAYVDRYRSERRVVSLDCHLDALKSFCVTESAGTENADPRLGEAIKEAFLQCHPEKRFLLAAYFFDSRTLAEIAVTLGVHESTVSRRMDRTLRELRHGIRRSLRKRGMTMREVEESFQSDVRTLSLDVRRYLAPDINLVRE